MTLATSVGTWSCPTTVHAGVDTLQGLKAIVPKGDVLLITDANLSKPGSAAHRLRSIVPVVHEVVRQPGVSDLAFLKDLLAAGEREPHLSWVACGGGSVLDVARLGALVRTDLRFQC